MEGCVAGALALAEGPEVPLGRAILATLVEVGAATEFGRLGVSPVEHAKASRDKTTVSVRQLSWWERIISDANDSTVSCNGVLTFWKAS